jgi:hypothetical protein
MKIVDNSINSTETGRRFGKGQECWRPLEGMLGALLYLGANRYAPKSSCTYSCDVCMQKNAI